MRLPAAGAGLHGVSAVLAVVLVAYLVAGQPVVGARNARRMRRALRADPATDARLARYYQTLTLHWCLVAVALAVVASTAGDLRLGDLGVRWPGLAGPARPYTVAGCIGLLASGAALVVLRRRVLAADVPVSGPAAALELLPRTPAERRAFAGLAVSAGVCEETLYRGFGLAVLAALVHGVAPLVAVAVSAVGFGVAHAYQGPAGILATLVVGGCLAVLFLGTGSLLLPVLFHALIDLRLLLLPVGGPSHEEVPGRA